MGTKHASLHGPVGDVEEWREEKNGEVCVLLQLSAPEGAKIVEGRVKWQWCLGVNFEPVKERNVINQ